ncbi:hypothetical protein Tco_0735925 [Tanacetum coccineum]
MVYETEHVAKFGISKDISGTSHYDVCLGGSSARPSKHPPYASCYARLEEEIWTEVAKYLDGKSYVMLAGPI